VSRPRVAPIHRPPTEGAHHFRRLSDFDEMRGALKKFGAARPSSPVVAGQAAGAERQKITI
jgi:hypothetical protein